MIDIKNLEKSFKKHRVLDNLNLQILPKQRIALVGQNGCGKTTLIRCILGLYQFEGEINIFGSSIKKNREEALQKISFVPQNPPALRGTVDEIMNLMSSLCNFPVAHIEPLAQEMGLELSKCLSTSFKNLSGGMKQKLLIAIALARRPSILIMDEPSANLDPSARAVFFNQLSKLPDETSMLLTSHRVDELSGIVSRVIEIDDGRVTMDDVVEAGDGDVLRGKLDCLIELKRIPSSVKLALMEWGFKSEDQSELKWKGSIPGADSFRFHATLTRWSGLTTSVSIKRVDMTESLK